MDIYKRVLLEKYGKKEDVVSSSVRKVLDVVNDRIDSISTYKNGVVYGGKFEEIKDGEVGYGLVYYDIESGKREVLDVVDDVIFSISTYKDGVVYGGKFEEIKDGEVGYGLVLKLNPLTI